MIIDKQFILREIAGDYIIIPTGNTILEFNGLITVNEVGAFLWNKLQQEITFEELTAAVLDEYDVTKEEAEKDIQEFLEQLAKGGILDEAELH